MQQWVPSLGNASPLRLFENLKDKAPAMAACFILHSLNIVEPYCTSHAVIDPVSNVSRMMLQSRHFAAPARRR